MAAFVAGGLLLAGCSGGTPATSEPTSSPSGQLGGQLRELDLSEAGLGADLIRRAGGGEVPLDRVRYVDLTGDGVEEAVVVVESGGTLGDIGVGVFRASGSKVGLVYFRKLTGRVDIRDRALIVVEGAPGPTDAACCPTQLRESVIEWRNGTFEVTAEQVVPNPAAGG